MKYTRDPKPEILRIEELVNQVKVGDIKLPKFQRPFVWNKADILTLWDSIYKGYPIGSILLWLTKEHLASERKIGDLEINFRPDEYPTNYLLDGQQRLSTLCGALYWNGSNPKSIWNIVFDLDREIFLYPDKEIKPEYFPLNKVLNVLDFLNQCKTFESHPKKDKFAKSAESLLKVVKDYKIAAVRIGDMKLNEVAPIFERINSTGRQLTIVDLMRAATWTDGGFDLNDAISSVRTSLEAKRFDDVPETHILRSISASANFGINRQDIEKLRGCDSTTLQASAAASTTAYQLAVDFLTTELPITSFAYLPYALQLTFLVEFFRICPQPSLQQRRVLTEWFWKGAFSRYFLTSNTGQNADDLRRIRQFASSEIDEYSINRTIEFHQFLNESFRLNKASSKTFALLLAHNKPMSLLDGSPVNTNSVLSIVNRHEFHHIFPVAFLKSSGIIDIDNHANICMLSMGNNRKISDSRPSVYFSEMRHSMGESLDSVLKSNYISSAAFDAALREDYPEFIRLRSQTLAAAAEKLCNASTFSAVAHEHISDDTSSYFTSGLFGEDELDVVVD